MTLFEKFSICPPSTPQDEVPGFAGIARYELDPDPCPPIPRGLSGCSTDMFDDVDTRTGSSIDRDPSWNETRKWSVYMGWCSLARKWAIEDTKD